MLALEISKHMYYTTIKSSWIALHNSTRSQVAVLPKQQLFTVDYYTKCTPSKDSLEIMLLEWQFKHWNFNLLTKLSKLGII